MISWILNSSSSAHACVGALHILGVQHLTLGERAYIFENSSYKIRRQRICGSFWAVPLPVLKRHIGGVIFAGIGLCCCKLIANALNRILIWHYWKCFAFGIVPILGMMLVSALVMKPRVAYPERSPASTDRRAVPLIKSYALNKFGRRKFWKIVYKAAKGNTAPSAVYKNSVPMHGNKLYM